LSEFPLQRRDAPLELHASSIHPRDLDRFHGHRVRVGNRNVDSRSQGAERSGRKRVDASPAFDDAMELVTVFVCPFVHGYAAMASK
jgi:hypothetical protein